MSTVFVDVGVSLDGYVVGPNRGPGNPLGDGGVSIHQWMFRTATFVADGIGSALEQAKVAAGRKDVRISGGAATIRQFIEAGLVEELTLHIAPRSWAQACACSTNSAPDNSSSTKRRLATPRWSLMSATQWSHEGSAERDDNCTYVAHT